MTGLSSISRKGGIPLIQIGLTGGIACGKSKALEHLGRLGAHTIDADEISHRLVEPKQPALEEIAREFGTSYIDSRGRLKRKELGQLVFSDDTALEKLNQILHPKVIQREDELKDEIQEKHSTDDSLVIVVDAALMVEAGTYQKYDYLLVAYCPFETQIKRLLKRDNCSEEEARNRIKSQLPLLEKIRYADYVIETSGPIPETQEQIEFIYRDIAPRNLR